MLPVSPTPVEFTATVVNGAPLTKFHHGSEEFKNYGSHFHKFRYTYNARLTYILQNSFHLNDHTVRRTSSTDSVVKNLLAQFNKQSHSVVQL